MISLTETQEDIIKELFNRGIGKAAEIISEMLSAQIFLSVPQINLGSLTNFSHELSVGKVTGIKQKFHGDYYGEAMILYSHNSCLEVISALLGYEELPEEFGHYERETLSEFGNIILTSCLNELESALNCKLSTSSPLVISGQFPKDFMRPMSAESDDFLVLNMQFSLSNTESVGRISLVLNPNDIKDMTVKLDAYLEGIMSV